ncbi:MAG: radical SAM protein [Candidatus Aminicenantes bacterium]|nr:radical SAM protein [Candidatus Aminicenantes bacterium]
MKGIRSPFVIRKTRQQHPLWRKRQPLLSQLDIELTERCNNNCIHCCINLPAANRSTRIRELDTTQWESILRQAADLGALTVRFTGGEPLLRKDFPDLYIIARKLGLKVLLFTNARLIDAKLAHLFIRIPPLERIEVTVFGLTRKSYETVTKVHGSFLEFQKGVRLLEENRIPFIIKGVYLPANADEVNQIEAWAAALPWMEHPPDFSLLMELRGRRDSPAKNRSLLKLRSSPETAVTFMRRHEKKNMPGMASFCERFVGIKGDILFSCGAGTGGCVDAYGRWQPCLSLRHPDLTYDLLKGSLEDALTRHFPTLKGMKAQNPDFLQRCARCFLRGLCEQCPAWSWSEHGNLDTPVEYLCQIAHAWAHHLGILAAGEKSWEIQDASQRIISWAKNRSSIQGNREGKSPGKK